MIRDYIKNLYCELRSIVKFMIFYSKLYKKIQEEDSEIEVRVAMLEQGDSTHMFGLIRVSN